MLVGGAAAASDAGAGVLAGGATGAGVATRSHIPGVQVHVGRGGGGSLAGERTAFPSRSVAYKSSAGATAVVTPISGTLRTVSAYPTIVQVQ